MFEYRLTEKPVASKKVKGLKTLAERYAHAMTEALNTEAQSGWEFVGQESFSVEDKAGMMKKPKSTDLTFLIFRREVASSSVPLDQKLEDLRNKKERQQKKSRFVPPVAEPAIAAGVAGHAINDEPTVVADAYANADDNTEPFPEPMPAYVPEEIEDPFTEEPELDVSRALPFPGPTPVKTMDMAGSNNQAKPDDAGPTMNYNHSNGSKGLSIEAPILGPARRD